MGAAVLIILIIIFIIIMIVINIVIGNLKYRAKQHVLGKVGLSNADLYSKMNSMQEEGALTRLLKDYPNFTEQTVKDTLYTFALNIINRQNNGYMSDKVINKMNSDGKLDKFRELSFSRVNVLNYRNNQAYVIAIFANSTDEYQITMNFTINNRLFYIISYDTMHGMTKGF